MFKIKTSLIQGFATLLLTSSLVWATPNHDDDNAQAVISRGMEAPAIQGAPSVITIQTSESSTALVTKDNVWPRKWSPFQHQEGWGKLHLHAIDRIFRHLMKADGIESIKSAAFSSRHWHYYTQTLEFKQALISTIKFQTGGDFGHNPGHPEKLFKPHRPYFLAFDKRTLSKLVHDKTFMNCLSSKSPEGQKYLEDFETTRQVASDPQTTSLILKGGIKQGDEDVTWKLRFSPTLHFDLAQLTELDLEDNNLTHLPDVGGMTNLQVLNLGHNHLQALPDWSLLVNLETLRLGNMGLLQMPDLRSLTKLQGLNLGNMVEVNQSVLRRFPNENAFKTPLDLSGLPQLEWFCCYNASVIQINGLERMTRLDDLSIDYNELTTISGLEALINLEILQLGQNPFSSLPNLSALQKLALLRIDGTPLTALEGLDQLTTLEEIDYSSNHAQAPAIMSALDRLTQLQALRNIPQVVRGPWQ